MESILEELWYGNICPNTDYRTQAEEENKLMRYIVTHHDKLWETLSDTQKEIFQKFDDCRSELTEIEERSIFIYAFRLGAKMMIEVMTSDTSK